MTGLVFERDLEVCIDIGFVEGVGGLVGRGLCWPCG